MKLNLCCGANIFPGWINIDRVDMEAAYLKHLREAPDGFVWPEPQRELAAWVKAGRGLVFRRHDVRQGLTELAGAGEVDAIYIGQAIEHFNRRTEAPALLRECLRVLKPGGAIRLTTPDLITLLHVWFVSGERGGMNQWDKEQPEFYASALPEDQLSYLMFGASGADCTAENFEGHFHCYTFRSLSALLMECGFRVPAIQARVPPGPFHDTRDFGMSHSFAIEAVKP